MNAIEEQTAHDIDVWMQKRLFQLFNDTLMRYEMAELPSQYAHACILSSMFMIITKALTSVSSIPAEEAGELLASLIKRERKKEDRHAGSSKR